MKELKLHIPEPCHENWSTMSETEKGKHCSKCQKEVIDFSNYSEEKFKNTIEKIHSERMDVCGRFDNRQLHSVQENSYVEIDYKKLSLQQIILLSFLVVFFLGGLASCNIDKRTAGIPIIEKKSISIDKHLENFNDLCNNKIEITMGSIVINITDPKIKKDSVVISGVDTLTKLTFDSEAFLLNQNTKNALDTFASKLKKTTHYSIEIIGHTDNRGTEKLNKELSIKRAQEVKNYLENLGVKVEICRGVGYQFPISDNTSMAGRASNRRVEIIVTIK